VSDEPTEADRTLLAAAALAKVKADAQARGSRPATSATGNFSKRNDNQGPSAARPAASRPRRDDPAPLNAAISGLISEAGWELAVATGSVFGRWGQIVGQDLAAHTSPESLSDAGELVVHADSTAWATQLRLLASQLVRRLNVELGDGAVRKVLVRGPGSASKQAGQWRVKGSRGERDTYG